MLHGVKCCSERLQHTVDGCSHLLLEQVTKKSPVDSQSGTAPRLYNSKQPCVKACICVKCRTANWVPNYAIDWRLPFHAQLVIACLHTQCGLKALLGITDQSKQPYTIHGKAPRIPLFRLGSTSPAVNPNLCSSAAPLSLSSARWRPCLVLVVIVLDQRRHCHHCLDRIARACTSAITRRDLRAGCARTGRPLVARAVHQPAHGAFVGAPAAD
mmetsp:Transcript_30448/g.90261  ORF Transcript_30448/g.90261 Transcript_30448/m.90261 type:complete len:213 (-) Transcript_30448:1588-2226(-)